MNFRNVKCKRNKNHLNTRACNQPNKIRASQIQRHLASKYYKSSCTSLFKFYVCSSKISDEPGKTRPTHPNTLKNFQECYSKTDSCIFFFFVIHAVFSIL